MMSKDNDEIRKKISDTLKGLMTDKNMKSSDKRSIAYEQRSNNPSFIKKLTESINKRELTDEIRQKLGSGRRGLPPANKGKKRSTSTLDRMSKSQSKPILTPNGPFLSKKEATIYYMIIWKLKFAGAEYRLTKLLNKENSGFERMSKEEYIKLTGLDPWNEK